MKTVSLEGKKGLVFGIANASSLAYGCARAFRDLGAELAVTYCGPKAEPHVRPARGRAGKPDHHALRRARARPVGGRLQAASAERWGRLDFLLHSIAFAPKEDLHGRVVDCSQAGFALAMDVSCHSFIRMAKLAEPLMAAGRMPADPDVLRVRESRRALQPDGAGEGGARERCPVHGRRTRPEGDPGPCHLAGPGEDPGGLGD